MQFAQLESLQTDFAAALLGAVPTPELIAATGASCVPQWLALYRRNVQAAAEKALCSAFPVVQALVGQEFFAGLACAYARAHASASGDLNSYGGQFASFLRMFEPAQALPYLGDVAALEWRMHRAHYAADARALSREQAALMRPQALLASRFALHPACAWIGSNFPIATIWRAHQPDSPVALPESLERHEWTLVARPHWRADVVESNAAEVAALATLRDGGMMDEAIGAALAHDAKFDFACTFVRWLDLALLVAGPSL